MLSLQIYTYPSPAPGRGRRDIEVEIDGKATVRSILEEAAVDTPNYYVVMVNGYGADLTRSWGMGISSSFFRQSAVDSVGNSVSPNRV